MAMYLSWTAWKNWTRELVEEAWAAGLWVLLNWEAMGDWSEFAAGAAGGKAAGLHAGSLCAGPRAPSWVPIVVSADYPAPPEHWDTITEWLKAFSAASGHPVGVYGGAEFGEAMLDRGAVVFWQANASSWSADERISPRASMVQFVGDGGLGVSVDENRVIDATPFAWRGDDQKPPAPSAPSPQEDDDMNRADTIALLRAPEFSQATTRADLDALAEQVAEIRDEQKATNLMLIQLTALIKGDATKANPATPKATA
jgi:hypothetical protein